MDLIGWLLAFAFTAGEFCANAGAAVLGSFVSDSSAVVLDIGSAATCDTYGNMTEVWSDGTTVITVGGCLATY